MSRRLIGALVQRERHKVSGQRSLLQPSAPMTCDWPSQGNYLRGHWRATSRLRSGERNGAAASGRERVGLGPSVLVVDGEDPYAYPGQRADRKQRRHVREVTDQPPEPAIERHAGDQVGEDR